MLVKSVLWFLMKTTEGTYSLFETQLGVGLGKGFNSAFLRSWSQSSTVFLTLLENDMPLISILHDHLSELVCTLVLRFLKADETGENRQLHAFSRCLQVREPAGSSYPYGEED